MAPLCLAKWVLCEGYGNMGCQVSKRGIQNFIYFCQKSTNFRKILDLAIRLQCRVIGLMGLIMENKVHQKLQLSKNVTNKNDIATYNAYQQFSQQACTNFMYINILYQLMGQFFCVSLSSICFLSRFDSCLQTYVLKKIKTARFMLCL